MKSLLLPLFLRLPVYLAALAIIPIMAVNPSESVAAGPRVQELRGYVDDGRGIVYALRDLKKGDVLYAYMANTDGNLDPLLGVLKKGYDRDYLRQEILDSVINSELNLIEAVTRFAESHLMAWDDDGGEGHNAMLRFPIPSDGTYLLFAGSMITTQHYRRSEPHWTSGTFRLLLGLNEPMVAAGEGVAAGDPFASVDNKYVTPPSKVEYVENRLNADKKFTFHRLRKLQPGDSFYARLTGPDGQPLPRLYLRI